VQLVVVQLVVGQPDAEARPSEAPRLSPDRWPSLACTQVSLARRGLTGRYLAVRNDTLSRCPTASSPSPGLAELYDLFCAWDRRDDFGFYLPMVMTADSVLDVGCGTGMLLRRARLNWHRGRLCGLDPAAAMLDVARSRPDIEWIEGDGHQNCLETERSVRLRDPEPAGSGLAAADARVPGGSDPA
jgi:SAM-dependent methyltransferase